MWVWVPLQFCHSFINNFITYFVNQYFCQRFLFLSSLHIWICYCDISASLSMHICSFQQSVSAICTSFIILCLFFCSAFMTLLEVIKLTFNVYSIKRINLRIFQTIFYYYIYENNSISYKVLIYNCLRELLLMLFHAC